MQKINVSLINCVYKIEKFASQSWYTLLCFGIILSWVYAISSQCCIPLPYNPVPLTMQSLTLLACAWLFGAPAVLAYVFYLMQGIIGAPFFSHFGSGLTHLLGPTGGYLVGFMFSMIFMAVTKNIFPRSNCFLLFKYWISLLICFVFGIAHLSFFIPAHKILLVGFYPFLVGDFIIKAFVFLILSSKLKH